MAVQQLAMLSEHVRSLPVYILEIVGYNVEKTYVESDTTLSRSPQVQKIVIGHGTLHRKTYGVTKCQMTPIFAENHHSFRHLLPIMPLILIKKYEF